jgi:hypothetical protein
MKRHCGSFAASPAARRSGGHRSLWGRCEAYKAAHAACRVRRPLWEQPRETPPLSAGP